MSKEIDRRKGLTLMEMVVAMAIAAVVLTITLTVYNIWWKSYTIVLEKTEIEKQMTSAMEIIVKELRLAKDVALDYDENDEEKTVFRLQDKRIEYGRDDKVNYLTDPVVDVLTFDFKDTDETVLEVKIENTSKNIVLTSRVRLLNKEPSSGSSKKSFVSFESSEKLPFQQQE
ncbi:prepilin-type N-terminal cleavage/methylation domain-containing protein [Mesotoga prima]|uniref:prepilin-type N-terminal cleavage/methylation domain-containing protein n=1 Tax=Mesotoga prima TaxID=1184387 RepID=UPI002C95DAAF|nr:prepilin-type N-terminal cleavage/methylation domain-containing protein [Mesotoga prima]HQC15388.1 prepilin-type N-terminal cleavage/methylation domain-containing protein [Mesotoga prima]